MKKILFAVLLLCLSGLARAESIVLTGTVTYSNSGGTHQATDTFTASNDGTTTRITDGNLLVSLSGLDSSLGGGLSIPLTNQTLIFGSGPSAETLTVTVGKAGNVTLAVSGVTGWSFTGTATTQIAPLNLPLMPQVPAVPAPEPGSLALVGSGILGLAGLLRRRFAA